MKTTRMIILWIFVCGMIFKTEAYSQVIKKINEDYNTTLTITVDKEKRIYHLTGVEIIKITPENNLLRIVTFKIAPENDPDNIMELANPVAFLNVNASGDFDGDGNPDVITDKFAVLTNSGNLKMVFHINGSSK